MTKIVSGGGANLNKVAHSKSGNQNQSHTEAM